MREAGHESQDDGNHVGGEWCHLLPSMISGGRSDDGTAQVAVLQHHHHYADGVAPSTTSSTQSSSRLSAFGSANQNA